MGNERPGQRKEWSVSEAQAGAPSLQRGSHALWPQGYGGPLAASMACGARDRMIRAGLRAPRGERSYDQNWAAPRVGSDGSCPTASPSEIGCGITRALVCDRGGNTQGGEEVSAHNSSTLSPSSTRDLSLEREPVRGASQPGHKGRIQGPLPTPRRGGGWVAQGPTPGVGRCLAEIVCVGWRVAARGRLPGDAGGAGPR